MSHHQTALKMSEDFLSTYRNPATAVDVRGQSAVAQRIATNRQILKSIASTVLFCGRQNIALRGHRDDATNQEISTNRGNFCELLKFRIEAGDNVLDSHLKTASSRATYISKTVQNQLITIIGNQIRDTILDEVRKAKIFSILADEVTDVSNWEQLSLVVRYVDMNNAIREQFLCFLDCECITGEALTKKICDTLQDLDLPIENLRGQGYDGGSNMAGHVKGVQGRIEAINDKAIYVHCAAHCLNLSIVKACQIPVMRNMLGT
ncbi:52 kDa repressor of the inhibitor of the protein kinase-like, partial [Mizuhopecten yessoensis]|uniref:52 kDa repressor of the inhibitor of the protein kinase-like n=1 Tax=Mizuhopecten yessoensis TaxID=6573 RepID=UPI000B4578A9